MELNESLNGEYETFKAVLCRHHSLTPEISIDLEIFRCMDVIYCVPSSVPHLNPATLAALCSEKQREESHLKLWKDSSELDTMLTHRSGSWECYPPPTLNLHPGQRGQKMEVKREMLPSTAQNHT